MARESAPQVPAPSTSRGNVREIRMTKTDPVLDNPRLSLYKEMGYEISDENWFYRMTGSQEEFERRQREYQDRGLKQAQTADRSRDSEGADSSTERTISTISRVPMTASEILGEEEGYVEP